MKHKMPLQPKPNTDQQTSKRAQRQAQTPKDNTAEVKSPVGHGEHILALQQRYGNRYVRRLLNQSTPEKPAPSSRSKLIQREMLDAYKNPIKSPSKLLNVVKKFPPFDQAYAAAQKLGVKDEDYADKIKLIIADPTLYERRDVIDILTRVAESKIGALTGQPSTQGQYDGLDVTLTSLNTDVQGGLTITDSPTEFKVSTGGARFSANALIEDPTGSLMQDWNFGFIQTVFSGDRELIYKTDAGIVRSITMSTGGPKKDGSRGSADVWYGGGSSTRPLGANTKMASVSVSMEDKPAVGLPKKPGDTVQSMRGLDDFKTWLVLRKKDGSATHYLHSWTWHIGYTADPALAATAGAVLSGESATDDGSQAVLGGINALDALTIKDQVQPQFSPPSAQNLGEFASLETFKTMKKKATGITLMSGQLPSERYESLVAQIKRLISVQRWGGAKNVIDLLLKDLDAMRTATKYWKSDALKQQYFMPIYETVIIQDDFIKEELRKATGGTGITSTGTQQDFDFGLVGTNP